LQYPHCADKKTYSEKLIDLAVQNFSTRRNIIGFMVPLPLYANIGSGAGDFPEVKYPGRSNPYSPACCKDRVGDMASRFF
jgi:hypothetical protein